MGGCERWGVVVEGGGVGRGVASANHNYTHTCRRTMPHTGIPPSKQRRRNIRKQRAQIKASRLACAAAAQKGVKSSVRRKQER